MTDTFHVYPQLAPKVRHQLDPMTGEPVLLYPESVLRLNRTGTAIISLCSGTRSFAEIVTELAGDSGSTTEQIAPVIGGFLRDLRRRRLIHWDEPLVAEFSPSNMPSPSAEYCERMSSVGLRPFGLLAELTYRCPLHCPYCSNPTTIHGARSELSTDDWVHVFAEAAALGVLHVHFSGGEPLLHRDLVRLVAAARAAGLYTNLLTSGVSLTRRLAEQLRAAGLDHFQLSFQADAEELSDRIAGASAHAAKLSAARMVQEIGWPLTVNVVLHRNNIHRIPQLVMLAEELVAERLELANVQFYGWGHTNRDALLPDRAALIEAGQQVDEARRRLRGMMEIIYVQSDALAERPKACMGGWGRRQMTVNPYGDVLPCPNSECISLLRFENVRDRSLESIWNDSEAFNRFRGTEWMPDPCRSCDLREVDFGGCRCQSFLLTGDAANTDPACKLAPQHSKVMHASADVWSLSPNSEVSTDDLDRIQKPLRYRINPQSTSRIEKE